MSSYLLRLGLLRSEESNTVIDMPVPPPVFIPQSSLSCRTYVSYTGLSEGKSTLGKLQQQAIRPSTRITPSTHPLIPIRKFLPAFQRFILSTTNQFTESVPLINLLIQQASLSKLPSLNQLPRRIVVH